MNSTDEKSLPLILLLEDDEATTSILKIWLRERCLITHAQNGEEALALIGKMAEEGRYFDLMLFDINIPFPWNGLTLMKAIRLQFPSYHNIPFIAQTAYAMPSDEVLLLDSGFAEYLAKPLNRTALVESVVRNLCSSAHA